MANKNQMSNLPTPSVGGLSIYLAQIKKFPMLKSGETDEWQDWLVDDSLDQELIVSQKQEYDDKKELLNSAMKILNEREKEIITARRLSEEPQTLEDLSKKYKISRERIRQIETKAFEKLQKSMINASKSKNLLPVN